MFDKMNDDPLKSYLQNKTKTYMFQKIRQKISFRGSAAIAMIAMCDLICFCFEKNALKFKCLFIQSSFFRQ